jgi:acyl carrier protein
MPTQSNPALTGQRVHEVLWDLAAKHAGKERAQLQAESRLVQDLGFDSLGLVEFAMELEEELGIESADGLVENPEVTLGEVEAAVRNRFLGGT